MTPDAPSAQPEAVGDILSRLVDLESRLAFQEHSLSELSDAVAASRTEMTRNADLLERALHDLRQLRTLLHADPADETPPPHW